MAALVVGGSSAQADSINIRVGTPPPAPLVEHRWAPPYAGAVWIGGHHEWVDGRWVWIGGYYSYPPRRGGHWIPGHYRHGYWRAGHWD